MVRVRVLLNFESWLIDSSDGVTGKHFSRILDVTERIACEDLSPGAFQ